MSSEARRGLDRDSAPESVLRARAAKAQIPTRSEFPSPSAVMEFFAGLPPQAEVELLALELDEIAADPADERRRAQLWLDGDLSHEERHAAIVQRDYPAFYEHLAVVRNQAWVPRIEQMLRTGSRAFIVVGVGHMVGPGSLPEQLERAGIGIERV